MDSAAIAPDRTVEAAEPRANAHPRFHGVDALRGLAALAVVLSHTAEQAIRYLTDGTLLRQAIQGLFVDYCNFGKVGVVAFFCISGFVIPFSFTHRRPAQSFVITRFFRLYPAYWTSVVGAVLLAMLVKDAAPPLRTVVANLTMVQVLFHQPDLIGAYWTLFYELIFYGLCLAAFLAGRLGSPYYVLSALLALMAAGCVAAALRFTGHGHGLPIGPPLYLAVMHFGTLARFQQVEHRPGADRCFLIGLVAMLLLAGPIAGFGFEQHAANQRLIADISGVYLGLFAFLAMRHGRLLIGRATLFLGAISYSLYLFHPLCLDAVLFWLHTATPTLPALLLFVLVPGSAILLATIVERTVEGPSNRLGKSIRKLLAA